MHNLTSKNKKINIAIIFILLFEIFITIIIHSNNSYIDLLPRTTRGVFLVSIYFIPILLGSRLYRRKIIIIALVLASINFFSYYFQNEFLSLEAIIIFVFCELVFVLVSYLIGDIAEKENKYKDQLYLHNEEKAKRAAESLIAIEDSLRYTRDLLEANLDPLVTINSDGLLTDVNTATEIATGLTREELINTDFCDYFTDPEKAKLGYKHAFMDGKIIDYELNLKHTNGSSIPVLYSAAVYKNKEGQVIGLFAANRDISNLKKAQDELAILNENLEILVEKRTVQLNDSRNYFELMFNTIPDAAIITQLSDGKILSVSDSFKEFFEYTREETIGRTQLELNIYRDINDRQNIVKELYQTGFFTNKEVVFIRKNGSTFTGLLSANTIKKDDILCVSSYIRDISERILQQEIIQELNSQLENRVVERTAQLELANKELEAFSYSVSHDLKAPVRHITGFASLLAKKHSDSLPEEGRQYLENVVSSAESMGELIDGLLQFSRTGRIEMNQTILNMNEIVHDLVKPIIEIDKDHRIKFDIATLPSAFGDLVMLQAVWRNLIENAVKFTKNKKIAKIQVGFQETKTEIVYYVQDNGAGFDMAYVSKLFNVFQRLHSRSDFEGTGIGLASIRRIITKHGGRTWAEGEVGSGAKFYFTLLKKGRINQNESKNDSLS